MTVGLAEGSCDKEGGKLGDPEGTSLGADEATGVGFELGIEEIVGFELGELVGDDDGLCISESRVKRHKQSEKKPHPRVAI